jgi:hypothetical protein
VSASGTVSPWSFQLDFTVAELDSTSGVESPVAQDLVLRGLSEFTAHGDNGEEQISVAGRDQRQDARVGVDAQSSRGPREKCSSDFPEAETVVIDAELSPGNGELLDVFWCDSLRILREFDMFGAAVVPALPNRFDRIRNRTGIV